MSCFHFGPEKEDIFIGVTILRPGRTFISKMISRDKIDLIMSNFQSHLSQSYRELFKESEFADVSLVTDDQIQIPGHRIILAAASPVLRNFFLRNSNAKPLIYLRGMNDNILESLLKYIYLGEVQIKYESIKEFMTAAKDLKIRELCEEDIADFDDGPQDMDDSVVSYPETVEKRADGNTGLNEGDLNCGDVDNINTDDNETKYHIQNRKQGNKEPENEGIIPIVGHGEMKSSVPDLRKKNYSCGVCNKQFGDRTTLRNHNLIKHHI